MDADQNHQREFFADLDEIYHNTPDGLVLADVATGRRIHANRRMCDMLGYDQAELPTDPALVHPAADMSWVRDKFLAQVEGLLPLAENIPFLRKDGTVFYADVSGSRVEHRGRPCILSFVRDVTARRQAEQRLRENADQLEAVYAGMIEGLLITEVATRRFVRVNPSFCRMLGYEELELLSKGIEDIHPPEAIPDDIRRFQAAADGVVTINEDRPVLRKDGSIFYADITGRQIEYEGRQCLLALFRDVTERRLAREALERERHTLRRMLRSSDHERQLIAYEIHDGLAQQLAAAIMQFQSWESLKDLEPEKARTAYEAGMQMLRQGHFEARRLISGVRPPILDESGITAAIAHLAHEHRTACSPEIDFRSLVRFDRLEAVLENAIYRIAQEALANACKHSGSAKVRVSLEQQGDRVRLEVEDWGVGFDPNDVATDHYGIEGIRQRTRLLGGEMTVISRPGKGTCLSVVLPLVDRDLD